MNSGSNFLLLIGIALIGLGILTFLSEDAWTPPLWESTVPVEFSIVLMFAGGGVIITWIWASRLAEKHFFAYDENYGWYIKVGTPILCLGIAAIWAIFLVIQWNTLPGDTFFMGVLSAGIFFMFMSTFGAYYKYKNTHLSEEEMAKRIEKLKSLIEKYKRLHQRKSFKYVLPVICIVFLITGFYWMLQELFSFDIYDDFNTRMIVSLSLIGIGAVGLVIWIPIAITLSKFSKQDWSDPKKLFQPEAKLKMPLLTSAYSIAMIVFYFFIFPRNGDYYNSWAFGYLLGLFVTLPIQSWIDYFLLKNRAARFKNQDTKASESLN